MPPDRPSRADVPAREKRIPESRVSEVIARIREDALAQFRQAGVPEREALVAVERVVTFALNAFLTEVEASWTLEALLTELKEHGASAESQRFADEKAAAFRLQLEAAIADIAPIVIRQIIQDLQNQPPRPEPVIEVRQAQPAPPVWWPVLLALLRHLVWGAGMAASLVFSYQGSGSIVWAGIGLLIPFLLWLRLHSAWWALLFPLTALGAEAWVLFWLSLVEG
jgi:hypothetical protein